MFNAYPRQSWIFDAVSRETELRSELVKGNAYRSMYLSAVVGLVASSSPWVMSLVPETLFLDRRRLLHMHTEFNCIVDRAAVLTMVVHLVIGNDRDPPLEKRTVGDCFVCCISFTF